MTDDSQAIELPITWAGVEDCVVSAANRFVVQFDGDLHYLVVGQLPPPVILGDDDEQLKQLRELSTVQVRPLARFALTRKVMEELAGLLKENLARTEPTRGSREQG